MQIQSAGAPIALSDQGPALRLAHPTPHAVGFPDSDRIFETIDSNGTAGADHLGVGLTPFFLLACLEEAGGEEQGRVFAAARSPELPSRHVVGGHVRAGPARATPFPRSS